MKWRTRSYGCWTMRTPAARSNGVPGRPRNDYMDGTRSRSGKRNCIVLSEREPTTDRRSIVAVVEIRDAGAMRNGDGQTAGHKGIRQSGKTIEALGEMVIQIERPLIEGAGARTA